MNKKYIIILLAVIVVVFVLLGGRGAEKTARLAIEAMYENDASKFVSLMHDDIVESQMDSMGLATKKLLIKKYEEVFDNLQKNAVNKYGEKYKYEVVIVDIYDGESSIRFDGKKTKEVAYEINYKGKGLFKKKDGSESGVIQLVKGGHKWYITDFN